MNNRFLMYILITLSILLISNSAKADGGAAYWMKVKIKTKEGQSYSGYFQLSTYYLYIRNNDGRVTYSQDRKVKELNLLRENKNPSEIQLKTGANPELGDYVQSLLLDTIKVYDDILMLKYFGVDTTRIRHIITPVGRASSIPKSSIESFNIETIVPYLIGSMIETQLDAYDIELLEEQKVTKLNQLGNMENCSYYYLQYDIITPSSKSKLLEMRKLIEEERKYYLGELKNDKNRRKENYRRQKSLVDELKYEGIIIAQFCSC